MVDEEGGGATHAAARDMSGLGLQTHRIRIEVASGADNGRIADLDGPEATIGKAEGCDFVLTDDTVSRLHLRLRVERDEQRGLNVLRVIDEGSLNGTFIDGTRIVDAYARPNSSIELGGTTLRLRMLKDRVTLPLSEREEFGRLVGKSQVMRRLYSLLERIAPSDATVLIEGETGTGKELTARAIHDASPRAAGPFIAKNCGAFSESLLESELFGHERGAFTGALRERPGLFEAAEGGTLFLDEIGELPLALQPKLLRVLQEREVVRVGSNKAIKVNVRIVAATNRFPLIREVEARRFREDLYYRLAVAMIRLPPLRERLDDVPLLVRQLEKDLSSGANAPPISDAAMKDLMMRSWLGNVRELRNHVERNLIGVGTEDEVLPAAHDATATPLPVDVDVKLIPALDALQDAFKRAYITKALEKTEGNVTRAAEIAGVGRRFIQLHMVRYDLRNSDDLES